MKYCKKCDSTKSLDEFYSNRSARDGKSSYCKPCWNEYMRQQSRKHAARKKASDARWLEANHERKLAQQAAWRAANAEHIKARNAKYRAANREAIRAYGIAYQARTKESRRAAYAADPEPYRERARSWQLRNPDKVLARNRRWREKNPEQYREQMRMGQARRRARRANLPSYVITDKDMRRLLSSACAVTGCTNSDIQIDHVIPIARGGSHGVGNFQPLCSSHNQSKGKRTWMEFRVYLALKQRLAA